MLRRLLLFAATSAALTLVAGAGAAPQAGTPVTETAALGSVRAELSYVKVTNDSGFTTYRDLRLSIARDGRIVESSTPAGSGTLSLLWPGTSFKGSKSVQVADLDGDREPEVELHLYSGGLHCCGLVYAYRWNGTAYAADDVQAGSSPYSKRDLDADGLPEWVTADPRFEYLFTSFAGSAMPIRIYQYRAGAFAEVTARYPTLVRRDLARWWRIYQRIRSPRSCDCRGILAGWAADMYVVGQEAKVWPALATALSHGDLNGPRGFGWVAGRSYITKLKQKLRAFGYAPAPMATPTRTIR